MAGNIISRIKPYKEILFRNIFTLFNFVNLIIAIVLFKVGSVKNCLFMIVVISNTLIGIVQEIRSKIVIDKLSILNKTPVAVIRNGKSLEIDKEFLLKEDIVELKSGCQIPNDCLIEEGECEVNESLVTGESDSVYKPCGEKLLSGSFVVSGECKCRVTAVGKENYANSLLGQIKYVKKPQSEIAAFIRRIIAVISICIIPFGLILFYNQYNLSHTTLKTAVESSSAALIGMIPEGLVLLISTVFALGAIRLAKENVLSQDLYALETLAKTDVLCLDKTGTITTGEMKFEKVTPVDGNTENIEKMLSIIAAYSMDGNSTINAVKKAFPNKADCNIISKVPFSSERKWSAVCTEEFGTIIMGAAENIFGDNADYSLLSEQDRENYRIVCVAAAEGVINDFKLPENIKLTGYLLLSEEVRSHAAETLKYFESQGVSLKVISGDNPATVSKLCRSIFGGQCECVDMSKVSDDEIPKIAETNQIFGRATPLQKKLIVKALRAKGHTVGMVGDGINDVLALKESDCSIAPANGSPTSRNISRLVLMDSDFGALPYAVSEGRRSINNLQNSASLFLSKTIFSVIMTMIFMFVNYSYPFKPIQMTLISALTIGFPSFVLSFIKNNKRVSGNFLNNIIKNSFPAALTNITIIIAIVVLSETGKLSGQNTAAVCASVMAAVGIFLIIKVYRPLTPLKTFVISVSITGFMTAYLLFKDFFGLYIESFDTVAITVIISALLFNILNLLFSRLKH